MSKIEVNEIAARTGTNISMTSGHTIQPNFHSSTTFPAGHTIQTVTNAFDDVTTLTTYGTTYTDLTGATITITPKFNNSKILIMPNIFFYMSDNSTYIYGGIRLLRGSSTVVAPTLAIDGNGSYDYGIGSATSGNIQIDNRHCGHHVDTPATTSATTYKFQGICYASGRQMTINHSTGSSSIVAMEIAQ